MKLEYLDKINSYKDDLIRLFDFDCVQAYGFKQLIIQNVIENKQQLDLSILRYKFKELTSRCSSTRHKADGFFCNSGRELTLKKLNQ